jgi:hypothetical protein
VRRALSLVFAIVWTATLRSATLPETVFEPLWDDAFAFLATESAFPSFARSTQPVSAPELRRVTENAQPTTALTRELLKRLVAPTRRVGDGFYGGFSTELRSRPEQSPRALPAFRAALRYGDALYQEWDIAPASERDEPVAGGETASRRVRPWNPKGVFGGEGYVADFRRTFLRLPVGSLSVTLGRQAFRWGPGYTGNLLLSDASPPLDGVSMSGQFGKVRGTVVFAALNTTWHDDGTRRYLARRYFAAHRLDWVPSPRLEIGVMDAVLYGGDARPMEWHYLNPVLPFYASQFNAGNDANPDFQDDNALIGFDARWNPRPGWALYGELLFDDYRYDPKSNDPHALAYLAGIHRTGIAERGEARMEYARVGRYTYTHLVPEQQYTHFGASLGYPTGNDADCLSTAGAWWLTPDARVSVEYRQTRKGDSGVDERFRGEADTSFLKGVAETRRELTIAGRLRCANRLRLDGSATARQVRNRDHIAGDNATRWQVRGGVAYEFSVGGR